MYCLCCPFVLYISCVLFHVFVCWYVIFDMCIFVTFRVSCSLLIVCVVYVVCSVFLFVLFCVAIAMIVVGFAVCVCCVLFVCGL